MRDALYQELQNGDIIVIIKSYGGYCAGIVIGETPSGKVKFVTPYAEIEFYDLDEDDNDIICDMCPGTYCVGHRVGFGHSKENCNPKSVIKVSEEQLGIYLDGYFAENPEDEDEETLSREDFTNQILEIHRTPVV